MDRGSKDWKLKLLVSACLAGCCCRYNGKAYGNEPLRSLARQGLIEVACPETLGGLSVPRPRAEIVGGTGDDVLLGRACVLNEYGEDVTDIFLRGAFYVLEIVQREGIKHAILKDKSPSCGVYRVYDGSFKGRLRKGRGVTSALLYRHGVTLFSEDEVWGEHFLELLSIDDH